MMTSHALTLALQRLAHGAMVAAALLVILLPVVLIVWLSFFTNEVLALPPEGYSLRWYQALAGQPQFLAGFRLSAIVAVAATMISLLVTIPAALVMARMEGRGREILTNILMSPLIVPAIVVGSGLYIAFVEFEIATDIQLNGATLGLIAGHALITLPWSLRLLLANLGGLNPALNEAALSLGATPLVAALKVTLPVIWPGLVAAALFCFVVSFSNVELSLFLVAPGQTTLPIALLQYLQWKIDPLIAAVSTLQILIVAGALLVTNRFVSLAKVV
ncbi:MAG: ABC transporter permease subunit [Beijerinckiaceae bacterium]|nr:ABC transporter permease subunit [Beijerinckiaceae bacterium]